MWQDGWEASAMKGANNPHCTGENEPTLWGGGVVACVSGKNGCRGSGQWGAPHCGSDVTLTALVGVGGQEKQRCVRWRLLGVP